MMMVKLPNLDNKEISWIIQAMEHYRPNIQDREVEPYQHLLSMLRHRREREKQRLN